MNFSIFKFYVEYAKQYFPWNLYKLIPIGKKNHDLYFWGIKFIINSSYLQYTESAYIQ